MNRYQAQLATPGWLVVDRLTRQPLTPAGLDIGSAHRLADEANEWDFTPESWLQ